MSAPDYNCYQFSPNYAWLRIWWFDRKSRYVGMTTTSTYKKGRARRWRYECMCGDLERAKLVPPPYKPSKREQARPTPSQREARLV